jgi:eukaryotic-like serine/threonine-protein kinase
MRDFIWKLQNWLEKALAWTQAFLRKVLPHAEDSPELRSLKIYVFLFIGIIGLMLMIGGITFAIAVRGQPETLVPNVQGKDVLDALIDLQTKELVPEIQVQYSADSAKDTVLSQRPAPGTLVKAGKHIILRVSKGPVVDKVENYVGWMLTEVKSHLQTVFATHSASIVIKTPIIYQYKAGVPSGQVIAQSPPAGTKITDVTYVELVVSQDQGAASSVVAGDYVGKSFQEAIQELSGDSIPFAFTLTKTAKGAAGSVVDQNPDTGTPLASGQVVQLTMLAPAAASIGKDNIFGLFKYSLPDQPIAVSVRLVIASDSQPQEIFSTKLAGGPLSVPYIVPDGSELVLYVLDQEVDREKAVAVR